MVKKRVMCFPRDEKRKKIEFRLQLAEFARSPYKLKVMISVLKCSLNRYNFSLCRSFKKKLWFKMI